MDKFTLTIFMALADRERELISIRTKAALAQSKKKLGNPDHLTPEAQLKGAAANRQDAQDAYRKQLNYIMRMRSDGMTLRAIATQLNNDGYTTRRDKQFTGATVHRILSRRENP